MLDVTEKIDEQCYLYYKGDFVGLFNSVEDAKTDAKSMWGDEIELREGEACGFPVVYVN